MATSRFARSRLQDRLKALTCAALLLVALPVAAADDLDARLADLSAAYARQHVNAVVLVGNRDGIAYEGAFGYADLGARTPMAVTTRFKTESVGKMFTATRVLELVEAGKLRLDDPAAKYLPGWRIPDFDKITIHQLLTHTSGLASMWDHPDYDFSRIYTPAELQKIIEEVPTVGPPGGKYFYSNSGFYLLGRIIEKVTGEAFDADLKTHVFDVAGMRMDHLDATVMPADAAQPYVYLSSSQWRPETKGVSPRAGAAGGWIGTAHDLYAFARHYLDGAFLDADARKMQWSANGTASLTEQGNRYGYGTEVFVDSYVPGKTIVGHSGGGGGFSVDMFMEPESGTVVIVMCNEYGMNREMSANYLRAALGLPTTTPAKSRLVRAVDHLLEKGLPYFQQDPARFFAEIDVPKYSAVFLANLAGNLDELKRPDLAQGVEETAHALYPEAASTL